MTEIQKRLFSMSDAGYKSFQAPLMPTVDPDRMIGVRTPSLRAYARELKERDMSDFLTSLPHRYYEEDNLHAFFICEMKDFDSCIAEVERLLPHIDNWATCDSLRPRCFKKSAERLLPYIEKWLKSSHTYTVRFAVGMLMSYFLDERFDPKYLEAAASVKSDEYYINMMIAWYFATALAKQWETAVIYINERRLPKWVHNKTVQKAIESYRISENDKKYLKGKKYV